MSKIRTRLGSGARSTRVVAGASAIATLLGVALVAPSAASASAAIVPLATSYRVDNKAGGVGDVRASWRNDGAPLSRIALTVPAPSGFYFQPSGTLTIYQLDHANNLWRGAVGPSIEANCAVTDGGSLIQCDSLAVSIPTGGSFTVSLPTYIARSAPVTGVWSIEPGQSALLSVGETRVESLIATSVSDVAAFELSVLFPPAGSRLISGTADPGTTAMVYDDAGAQLGSALASTGGAWQLTLDPGHGMIDTVFRAIDGAQTPGPSGYFNSYTFSVSPPVSGGSRPASATLAGAGQPGSLVSVRDASDRELVNGRVDSSGSWSLLLPETLQAGTHDLVVVNTISDGSATSVPVEGVVVYPTLNAPSPAATEVGGSPALELAVTVADSGAVANGETVRTVRAVVTDRSGVVAGVQVRFDTPDGISLSSATALTNLRGEAFTTITATHTKKSKISVVVGETRTTAPVRFATR